MAELNAGQTNTQGGSSTTCLAQTETVVEDPQNVEEATPVLTLRLHQPDRTDHKVKFSADTVDNEFMGKKKSKCCCIYEKPKVFGESDTSSDEEAGDEGCTPHCRGHKKKCFRHHKKGQGHDHDEDGGAGSGHHHHDNDGAGPSGCTHDNNKAGSSSQVSS